MKCFFFFFIILEVTAKQFFSNVATFTAIKVTTYMTFVYFYTKGIFPNKPQSESFFECILLFPQVQFNITISFNITFIKLISKILLWVIENKENETDIIEINFNIFCSCCLFCYFSHADIRVKNIQKLAEIFKK